MATEQTRKSLVDKLFEVELKDVLVPPGVHVRTPYAAWMRSHYDIRASEHGVPTLEWRGNNEGMWCDCDDGVEVDDFVKYQYACTVAFADALQQRWKANPQLVAELVATEKTLRESENKVDPKTY